MALDDLTTRFSKQLVTSYSIMHNLVNPATKTARAHLGPRTKNRRPARPPLRRSRRRPRFDGDAASHIQRLFHRFPTRAARFVLDDKKPAFCGDVEEAAAKIENTYSVFNNKPVAALEANYEFLADSPLSTDETSFLGARFSADDFADKLKKSKNTAPGGVQTPQTGRS